MTERGIYDDEFAALMKKRTGQKYQPSNGTEGDAFMSHFCDRCKKDAEYRETGENSCVIVAKAFAYDKDDPGYPVEWQYGDDGQPTCTAFEVES